MSSLLLCTYLSDKVQTTTRICFASEARTSDARKKVVVERAVNMKAKSIIGGHFRLQRESRPCVHHLGNGSAGKDADAQENHALQAMGISSHASVREIIREVERRRNLTKAM